MKFFIKPLFNIFLVGVLCSCSTAKVITYTHASATFDQYQTYRIKPHTEVEALSRKGHETFQQLDTTIAGQMTSRGYQTNLDPDLVIQYEISTGLSQNTPNQSYDRYSYGWYYPDYNYQSQEQDVEAMIEIEMIDTNTKKTVWTGSADFMLKPRRDDNVVRIQEHILHIFEKFEYAVP